MGSTSCTPARLERPPRLERTGTCRMRMPPSSHKGVLFFSFSTVSSCARRQHSTEYNLKICSLLPRVGHNLIERSKTSLACRVPIKLHVLPLSAARRGVLSAGRALGEPRRKRDGLSAGRAPPTGYADWPRGRQALAAEHPRSLLGHTLHIARAAQL